MKIGELANRLDMSTSAIRYYESLGLIGSVRGHNGYRYYSEQIVDLLGLILQAKQLGFSLTEIKAFSTLFRQLGQEQGEIRTVLEQKMAELDQRINQLQDFKANIAALLEAECPL